MISLVGLVLGCVFIVISIISGGNAADFINFPSVMIVVGGTIGAMMVNYPLNALVGGLKSFMYVITYKKTDRSKLLEKIVELSYVSKKEGLLALENHAEEIADPFMKKAILLVVDGTNPELTQEILELELSIQEQKSSYEQDVLLDAAKLAPAFGMIGTLIGLIIMLKNLNDYAALGPSMAVALITTFYGAVLANLIFNPLAGRLKAISRYEVECREMVITGIMSIQAGESPFTIKEKLGTYITEKENVKEKGKKLNAQEETA